MSEPPPQMYCRAEQAKRNRLQAQRRMKEKIERDRKHTPPSCVVEAANYVMHALNLVEKKTAEEVLKCDMKLLDCVDIVPQWYYYTTLYWCTATRTNGFYMYSWSCCQISTENRRFCVVFMFANLEHGPTDPKMLAKLLQRCYYS
eukprot:COSAG02_NODE_6896_length_3300_cov_5.588254_4_plen_145_part_00